MTDMKEKLNDEQVENVSGGIPGQLITHVVSTAVNAVLGAGNAKAGHDSKMPETETLKAKKDGSRLIKF